MQKILNAGCMHTIISALPRKTHHGLKAAEKYMDGLELVRQEGLTRKLEGGYITFVNSRLVQGNLKLYFICFLQKGMQLSLLLKKQCNVRHYLYSSKVLRYCHYCLSKNK